MNNLILLIEYHVPQNKARHDEYLECLKKNIKNQYISKIEIFIEADTKPPIESSKINYNIVSVRPTFQNLFYFCNKTYPDQICIISNSDIIFDNTLGVLNQDNMKNKFLALSRRDDSDSVVGGHYSQDVWVFKSPVKIESANFRMGILGCDNRISYLASKSGMMVTNPAYQIRAKHLHKSQYRTAERESIIPGPYLFVVPNNDINKRSIKRIINRKN
jgi:hypothetical protein